MSSAFVANIKRTLIVLSSVVIFTSTLRAIIEFVHPKTGWLNLIVQTLVGENAMQWVWIYIASPSYDFLIHNVWANSLIFWLLNILVLLLAFVLTKPRKIGKKYT